MALFTATLLGLNPDVEKHNYLTINTNANNISYLDKNIDLKDAFFLFNSNFKSNIDYLKDKLDFFLSCSEVDLKISPQVYNNAILVLDNLYPSIYNSINVDDIYTSNYGTVILDWEKDNNDIFSLEIGSEKLGYFIEINNVDVKQVEEIEVRNSLKDLLLDLSNFLNN